MFEGQERRSEVTGAGGRGQGDGACSGITGMITQMSASTLSASEGLYSGLSRGANLRF